MNILYISNHLNIGGITSYLFTLSSGMIRKGHRVFLASSGGQMLSKFTQEGVVFLSIPIMTKQELSPKIILSMFELLPFVKKEKIEIIHSQSRTTQVLACLLKRFADARHITTCHGFFKNRLHRRLFPSWGEMTIAISQQVKEHLIDDFGVNAANIRVINNGIAVEKFAALSFQSAAEVRLNLGLAKGPIVGIIARLSDVKGHRYLIEAMQQVTREMPDTQLLLVGEGKEKKELVDLTEKLGMAKKVIFQDTVSSSSEVLSAIDVFVMPSLKEGLGLAIMEAMASGLPIVASNIGGIRSLIQDKVTGILVEPADTKGLASAIIGLLQNKEKALSLGQKAKAFIKENFSEANMVCQTEQLYLECLGKKNL